MPVYSMRCKAAAEHGALRAIGVRL